jgi:prepilin-type N-terminal cleavage/methylation domain-containing protein
MTPSTTHTHENRWLRRLARREDGFTLVEMLVAMIFLAVLFTAFAALASTTVSRSTVITNDSVLQTQIRSAVNELVGDLRQAYPPSSSATSSFASISANGLTFYSPDSTYSSAAPTTFNLREISYQVSGGTLQRRVALSTSSGTAATTSWSFGAWGSWLTQVSGVTSTNIFTYYNNANPPVQTTDPTQVATVVVTLSVTNPQKNGPALVYTDSASLRVAA